MMFISSKESNEAQHSLQIYYSQRVSGISPFSRLPKGQQLIKYDGYLFISSASTNKGFNAIMVTKAIISVKIKFKIAAH